MKLYWCPQTRSLRALWMLEEAGRPYERIVIDIRSGEQSQPAYRAINPMMKVPALVDDGVLIAESGAICAYVAETCPEADLAPPVGHRDRGAYLRWLFFSGNCIEGAYLQKALTLDVPGSQAGWGDYDRVMNVLDQALAPGPWLLGERFSAADVVIGADLWFGMSFKMVEPRPSFAAYVARCEARPAFQRALAIEAEGQQKLGPAARTEP